MSGQALKSRVTIGPISRPSLESRQLKRHTLLNVIDKRVCSNSILSINQFTCMMQSWVLKMHIKSFPFSIFFEPESFPSHKTRLCSSEKRPNMLINSTRSILVRETGMSNMNIHPNYTE